MEDSLDNYPPEQVERVKHTPIPLKRPCRACGVELCVPLLVLAHIIVVLEQGEQAVVRCGICGALNRFRDPRMDSSDWLN